MIVPNGVPLVGSIASQMPTVVSHAAPVAGNVLSSLPGSVFMGLTLVWVWMVGCEEGADDPSLPEQARAHARASQFPIPKYLKESGYKHTINVGVIGLPGCGKSSLVNALRGVKPNEDGSAGVGLESNMEPVPYDMVTGSGSHKHVEGTDPISVRLWDLPAVQGLDTFSASIRDLGLRYFDALLIVFSGRFTEVEEELSEQLTQMQVPNFLVRAQVDVDIENGSEVHSLKQRDVLVKLREEMRESGHPDVYIVSAVRDEEFDLLLLVGGVVEVVHGGRRPRNDQTECPVCYETLSKATEDEAETVATTTRSCLWCTNSICHACAGRLQSTNEAAPCPLCRRLTPFLDTP